MPVKCRQSSATRWPSKRSPGATIPINANLNCGWPGRGMPIRRQQTETAQLNKCANREYPRLLAIRLGWPLRRRSLAANRIDAVPIRYVRSDDRAFEALRPDGLRSRSAAILEEGCRTWQAVGGRARLQWSCGGPADALRVCYRQGQLRSMSTNRLNLISEFTSAKACRLCLSVEEKPAARSGCAGRNRRQTCRPERVNACDAGTSVAQTIGTLHAGSIDLSRRLRCSGSSTRDLVPAYMTKSSPT